MINLIMILGWFSFGILIYVGISGVLYVAKELIVKNDQLDQAYLDGYEDGLTKYYK